jgi:hypothetical protein
MLRTLAFCLGLLLARPARATSCQEIIPEPMLLTSANATARTGGGIVIAYATGHQYETEPQKTWTFRDGGKPTFKNIAPGLDVLVIDKPDALRDGKGNLLVDVTTPDGKQRDALLGAPAVTQIDRTESGDRMLGEHWREHLFAKVKVPATAVALVVFDAEGKVARTWGRVTPGTKGVVEVVLYSGGSCGWSPKGMYGASDGDRLRLAWLDTSGRLSKLSKPIRVKKTKR